MSMAPRRVVVTGCGSGIGRAIILRLAADGWRTVGIEIKPAASARTELGAGHTIIEDDAADRAVLEKARDAAEKLAPLGGWVSNVGIAIMSNLHEPNPAEVERLMSVNLMSHHWGCSEAISTWVRHKATGAIVNVSSAHARAAFNMWASYDVDKAGANALARYIAVEYGPIGIRANSTQPGATATALVKQVIANSPKRGGKCRSSIRSSEFASPPRWQRRRPGFCPLKPALSLDNISLSTQASRRAATATNPARGCLSGVVKMIPDNAPRRMAAVVGRAGGRGS